MIRDGLKQVVDGVTKHNRITILVMLILTGVVVAGIPMLDTESQAGADADAFDDLERVETAEYISDNYGERENANTTVATVYVSNESGNVLSKASLLEGLRYQEAVSDNASLQAARDGNGMVGISNLIATRAAGVDDPSLEAQIEALESSSAAEVESLVAETLANDPQALRFLPSDHDPESTTAEDRRLLFTIDTEVSEDKQEGATETLYDAASDRSEAGFFTLGPNAAAEYNAHFTMQATELVLPIALLLILFVLVFAYRDLVDVVVGMTGVALSVIWMFGIMGWLGVSAGTISIIPAVLITGLSVDFGFHVFNRYREERGDEEGIRAPMNRGVRYVATALILVTVTAAIGFLSNLANPLPVIRNLGVSITLGVVSAFVLFTTIVPALKISIDGLLERFGLDRSKGALGRGRFLAPALGSSVRIARRAAPFVIVLAVAGAAAGGLLWADIDQEQFGGAEGDIADWKQDLPEPLGWDTHQYEERSSHVDEAYKPAGAVDSTQSRILIENNVTDDGALQDIHDGTTELREEGIVLEASGSPPVVSPVTAMQATAEQNESFAATFDNADTDGDGVPEENLASLYDAFYDADSEMAGQVIERTDGEYRSLLVTVTLNTDDWTDRGEYVDILEGGAATMSDGGEHATTVAGSFAISQSQLDALQSGILLTMFIALSAAIVVMAIIFRLMHGTATLGVVVAVPIILVVGLVIGGMYLLEIPLNLLTALLMSLVIGLGIDYNIHLGDRFADERREGADTYEALERAVTGTGGALLGSTLTSVCAFATLILVPSPGMQSFGSIVVVALSTAFVASVFVLPSIIALWSRFTDVRWTSAESHEKPTAAAEDALTQD
ncbi:MAG: RND family transporter [Halobacteriales archaeon]